jgi:hypothetical protein
MELKSFFAQDADGNTLPGATCYLYEPGTSTLASGLQTAAGAELDNPFQADADALIQFRAPDGEYDLRVTSGARDYRLRVQCVDLAAALARAEDAADRAEDAAARADDAAGTWSDVVPVTASRALGLSDLSNYLRSEAATAINLTVPPQSDVAWPDNAEIQLRVAGAGSVTLVAGSGVSLNPPAGGSLTLSARMGVLLKRAGADDWDIVGQTEAEA